MKVVLSLVQNGPCEENVPQIVGIRWELRLSDLCEYLINIIYFKFNVNHVL